MKRSIILLAFLISSTMVYAYNPTIEVMPSTETNHQVSFSVSVSLRSGTNWFTVVAPPEYKKHKLTSFALVGGGPYLPLATVSYETVDLTEGELKLVPKTLDPKVEFPVDPARFLESKLAVRYANGPMNGITFWIDLKAYADKKKGDLHVGLVEE